MPNKNPPALRAAPFTKAIVHGIVTGHHGTITMKSQPGEGSTFDIYLPVLDDKERGAQP